MEGFFYFYRTISGRSCAIFSTHVCTLHSASVYCSFPFSITLLPVSPGTGAADFHGIFCDGYSHKPECEHLHLLLSSEFHQIPDVFPNLVQNILHIPSSGSPGEDRLHIHLSCMDQFFQMHLTRGLSVRLESGRNIFSSRVTPFTSIKCLPFRRFHVKNRTWNSRKSSLSVQ